MVGGEDEAGLLHDFFHGGGAEAALFEIPGEAGTYELGDAAASSLKLRVAEAGSLEVRETEARTSP